MTETFSTPDGAELDLRVDAGEVEIDARETSETRVTVLPANAAARDHVDKVRVDFDGHAVRVEAREPRLALGRRPAFRIEIVCPEGSRLRARVASADVTARGRLGAVDVKSASGDVTLDAADGDVRVESASGDARVERVRGTFEFRTASGDLDVRHAEGPVTAHVVSGDVKIGDAVARVTANSVSGDLTLARVAGGPVQVDSVSGDVEIRVARGAAVWLDVRSLSGDTVSELAGDAGPADGEAVLEIRGKTVSGDVRIARAAA